MTTATLEQYDRACAAMLAAGREWMEEHPRSTPRFNPLGVTSDVVVIANLDRTMVRRVSANAAAVSLLTTLEHSVSDHGGASVLMAEAIIEMLYGIPRALTVRGKSW